MDAKWHVLLSFALTFGVPLALALREFVLLRRPDDGSWPGDGPAPPMPQPLPPDMPRRLPDCLIPKLSPTPAQARVPETV
jgi:hypothetical protein